MGWFRKTRLRRLRAETLESMLKDSRERSEKLALQYRPGESKSKFNFNFLIAAVREEDLARDIAEVLAEHHNQRELLPNK